MADPPRPPVAWLPISAAAAAVTGLLAATGNRYDYHRDELYFRMLEPAWGYVDQPPLTPFLARAATNLIADTVWAIRLPAALCLAAAVVLTALTTRELGGGRGAQALSAWGFGLAGIPLVFGHLMLTATVDLALWAGLLLLAIRALLRDPRWWLGVGAVAGSSLYNKHLVVLLALGLAAGLLLVGPRRVLYSGWLGLGVLVALVIGAPNLIYQAAHGWPQLAMAGAVAENQGDEGRILLLPLQMVLLGLPLVPIWVAGLVALLRRPQWRPVRALALAYPVMLVIVFASSGQFYYPLGVVTVLFAAGCVPVVDWARNLSRRALLATAVAVNAGISLVIALPLVPVDALGGTPIPELNQTTRDQLGWPAYTRQIAEVYHSLPPAQAADAVIITSNYGQAGALDRYGGDFGLPEVFSGHNELHRYGPPPESATTVVTVGLSVPRLAERFERCEPRATLDNEVGVDNEEQGVVVAVCHQPRRSWAVLWPDFQHYS